MPAAGSARYDVSVVIPTFNRLWSLPRAVDSCRGTMCSTQIIVVDDGSSDGTWEWLQAQDDVIAIRQNNAGQTWAVNRGTAVATGEFIRFLDSDDALAKGAIDLQLSVARASSADIVYSRVDEYLHATGTIVERGDLPDWDDFLAVQLGEGDGGHYLGMLFHRRLVEAVPRRPDFSMRDDRMFLLEVGLLAPKVVRTSGLGGFWTKHASQMHVNYRGLESAAAAWQYARIYERILSRLEQREQLTARRARAAAPVIWNIAHDTARFDVSEGAELAGWASRLDPNYRYKRGTALGAVYRLLGFRTTELLLTLRRAILNVVRGPAERAIRELPLPNSPVRATEV